LSDASSNARDLTRLAKCWTGGGTPRGYNVMRLTTKYTRGLLCGKPKSAALAKIRCMAHCPPSECPTNRTGFSISTIASTSPDKNAVSMDPDKPLDPSVANSQTGRTNIERFLGPDAPTVREILEEFRATETGEECPESRGFLDKLKSAFGG
jgi:hypothetical protein